MTIWLLALLLLACLAALGHQLGAIRVGISFFGLLLATLLAGPLARLVKPAVSAVGVANPILLWVLPPFIIFLLVLSVVKVGALAVHKKVDVYYKYKAGELRLALWERLNARLGACLGLLNGLVYLVLISWVAFALSYWTTQMASSDTDPKLVRLLNRIGRDVESTGMANVARAMDPLPAVFYEAADLAGFLYQNPLKEARLSRYPAFLPLAERPEFQALAQDKSFAELRVRRAPIREMLDNPNISAIVNNPDELRLIWGVVIPDMKDLESFLQTGTSEKYSDKILGRWFFDVNAAMVAYRKAKPNLPSSEMVKFRRSLTGLYSKMMLVAMPDGALAVKNLPQPKTPGGSETQNLQGRWKSAGSEYELNLGGAGDRHGKMEAGRLVLTGEGLTLVFAPED
jgi:hypothetical protein